MEFNYFPIKGIAEPIRRLLIYLKVDWKENNYNS